MSIIKIVLTGGPCSGKTIISSKLEEYFRKKEDYLTFVVPETATELIKSGITPYNSKSIFEFQSLLFCRQFNKEMTTELAFNIIDNKSKNIVLYDRALLDNKAYLEDRLDFDKFLNEYKLTELQVLDHYDLVINLLNMTGSDISGYETESNKMRFETESEAQIVDHKTTEAWAGHNNILIIPPQDTIEKKTDIVIKEIENFISGNMKSTVKRYRIDNGIEDFSEYNNTNSRLMDLEMIYLDCDEYENKDVIITKRTYNNSHSYNFTISKEKHGERTTLVNKMITEEDAINLIKNYEIKKRIEKRRLYLTYSRKIFNIDFYEDETVLEYEKKEYDRLINLPPIVYNPCEVSLEDINRKNSKVKTKTLKNI